MSDVGTIIHVGGRYQNFSYLCPYSSFPNVLHSAGSFRPFGVLLAVTFIAVTLIAVSLIAVVLIKIRSFRKLNSKSIEGESQLSSSQVVEGGV